MAERLERWLPLFEIFLNSAAPESDASVWFDNHHHSTSAFLSLLLSAAPSSRSPPPILLQTVPPALQSRILSFLAVHHRCFPRACLRSLAAHFLDSSPFTAGSDFWARKAADHLLGAVSSSAPPVACGHTLDHLHRGTNENDVGLYALPQWLKDPVFAADPLLPWLPLPAGSLPRSNDRYFAAEPQAMELVALQDDEPATYSPPPPPPPPPPPVLDPQIIERTSVLKAELLASEAAPKAILLAKDIRQLCLDSGTGSQLMVLGLIQPWEADDEMASVLLSNLSGEHGLGFVGWHAHVLCSLVLPKLLTLQKPASRVLLSATTRFCQLHPVAAVEALLLPLALRKGGLNVVLCDALARVIRECLHPVHVSAFCQRLLCGNAGDRRPVCLPCHGELLSDELVWTESLFTLFNHVLNHNVCLTPDTADQLVSVIDEKAHKFSKSLKFGNFMLCFVSKCARASSLHKVSLERAALRTETFVTKSILSKLSFSGKFTCSSLSYVFNSSLTN
ncbi:hypothetical protein BHM03_00044033 [Ensete ventricosum]|nr:hypothetical protein BHM03_00044033 [Ensete ventricosum]